MKLVTMLPALVVGLVLFSCTDASAVPFKPEPRPSAVRSMTAPLEPVAPVTGVVVTSAPRYVGVGAQHSAFPGMAPVTGGLQLTWRQGSDHYLSRDGALLSATTTDEGRTYSAPTTLLATPGMDYRDPSLSVIDGHTYLTYFTGSATNPAEGAYVTVDGGPAVRIDPGFPYAAIASPVVKLPDGRLGVGFYGRLAGETKDSAWMGWSTDGGATWTVNRILNPGSGIATNEPVLIVDGNRLVYLSRWGGTQLAARVSLDSGATWAAPYIAVSNATGRPSAYRTAAGTIVMVYREASTKAARLAYSLDKGATWTVGSVVLAAPAGSPLGMTYAAMAEVLPGVVYVVVGMEQADGSSALYGTYLAERV